MKEDSLAIKYLKNVLSKKEGSLHYQETEVVRLSDEAGYARKEIVLIRKEVDELKDAIKKLED